MAAMPFPFNGLSFVVFNLPTVLLVFLLLSDRYPNPEGGFEPGSLSEFLLEFDSRS